MNDSPRPRNSVMKYFHRAPYRLPSRTSPLKDRPESASVSERASCLYIYILNTYILKTHPVEPWAQNARPRRTFDPIFYVWVDPPADTIALGFRPLPAPRREFRAISIFWWVIRRSLQTQIPIRSGSRDLDTSWFRPMCLSTVNPM